MIEILYQDESLVAVEKPAGVHVHPPEDGNIRIRASQNGLAIIRDQIGQWLYPVHRLDPGTTGVLIYALTSQDASALQAQFSSRQVSKEYWAIVRGFAPLSGSIERPLKRDSNDTFAPAFSEFRRVAKVELEHAVRPHATARYSWLSVKPRTGVYHQIRRHLAGLSHPILGDSQHGDLEHNRLFRDKLGLSGLCLRALQIQLKHPRTGQSLEIRGSTSDLWEKIRTELPWAKDVS